MKKVIIQIGKFFVYLAAYAIYPFSFLFPRNKDIMAFGSFHGAFIDNPKYLFLYINKKLTNKRPVWLSTDKNSVLFVRHLGYEAYSVLSIKGVYFALRAKYWFINCYTSDILFCLAGGAIVVNLWHGVPMKCIEFGITQGELAKRYVQREFWDVFFHPASFRRPDYFASTTDFFDEVFSKSFRIEKSQCLHVGCARNQLLLQPLEKTLQHIEQYEAPEILSLVRKMQQYDKVYVYMPTWRDSQLEIFANGFDLDQFNETLKGKNYLALMKPHINTRFDKSREYSNLIFLPGNVDMYPILPFTDVLITDYSGTIYDYLLMPNKGIVLFHYDYEEYVKEREFIFPIIDNIAGKRVYSFEELLQTVISDDDAVDPQMRAFILSKFWGDTMNKDVCANILRQLNITCEA